MLCWQWCVNTLNHFPELNLGKVHQVNFSGHNDNSRTSIFVQILALSLVWRRQPWLTYMRAEISLVMELTLLVQNLFFFLCLQHVSCDCNMNLSSFTPKLPFPVLVRLWPCKAVLQALLCLVVHAAVVANWYNKASACLCWGRKSQMESAEQYCQCRRWCCTGRLGWEECWATWQALMFKDMQCSTAVAPMPLQCQRSS